MDTVTVRARRTADLPACVAALLRVHHSDRYPRDWPTDPARWLTPAESTDAWLAEHAGRVVGHAVLLAGQAQDAAVRLWLARYGGTPADVAVLGRLFTDPQARGLGVAARLLDTAIVTARSRGRQVVLDVVADDPAARYYEHRGWRPLGTGELVLRTGERWPLRCYAAPEPAPR